MSGPDSRPASCVTPFDFYLVRRKRNEAARSNVVWLSQSIRR
jgi:hypothetical protein